MKNKFLIILNFSNVNFIHADIDDMPLKDNYADVVVSNCVLNLVPNKDTAVVIYCAAGVRADMACQFMQQQGYSKVSNGINAGSVALSMNLPIDRL